MTTASHLRLTPGLRRLRGRSVAASALILAVTVLGGFLAIGQLSGPSRPSQTLEAETEGDLARILASLNTEADALQEEISTLRLQLLALQTSSQRDEAAAAALDEELRALQVLAGTVPVTGPGVVVSIRDPNGLIGYDALIDLVQELRDAGAEALAVNGLRIGVRTAFAPRDGAITVDGTPLEQPYRVEAIGQPATLDGGLKIPGGAVDTITALGSVKVEVARQARIDLPALATPPTFDVARPVGSAR